MTQPDLVGIPQGCHVWHMFAFILSYLIRNGESSFLRLWRHQPYLACIMFTLSLLKFPLESLLFHWTKINCLWNRMNQSTPSFLLPIPIPSFILLSITYLKGVLMRLSYLFSVLLFFQLGHFSFQHPLCLLFLASCCFPVVTPYFESWVVVLAKLAGFEDDELTAQVLNHLES